MENESNNLKNLPPFFVGQKVVLINKRGVNHEFNTTLKLGATYIIEATRQHGCDKWEILLVGYRAHETFDVQCSACNKRSHIAYAGGIRWFLSDRFAPLQSQSFPLISLSKVIEKQLVSAN